MAQKQNITFLAGVGMNSEDTPQSVAAERDILRAYNMRFSGSAEQEANNGSNIESSQLITISTPDGINKGIGGGSFEDVGYVAFARYNSAGNNQIVLYNKSTQTEQVIFEDITDTDGEVLFPLDPQKYLKFLLINKTFMVWVASNLEVGYTNLNTLKSGGYGTVLWEDLSLLKPQCLIPITGYYISDPGRASNFLKNKLFQFTPQYTNADYNYSAWGTWSKRIIPPEESTPTVGTDVTANNGIILGINIGSIRAKTINIAARYGTFIFNIIRSVERAYVIALPNTTIDISNQIYEAYDPGTNIYSFVFYNEDVTIPVTPTETDLAYDNIWPANAIEKINGNIIGIADFVQGYPRPTTAVTVQGVGYNPNITVPLNISLDPLFAGQATTTIINPFSPKSKTTVVFGGTPATNDVLTIVLKDSRDASAFLNYAYTVPAGQDGDLAAVIASFTASIPNASYATTDGGVTYTITIIADFQISIQSAYVTLYNAGVTVSRSIHSFLDNSSYQGAIRYYDRGGRYFPLCTDNTYIFQTPSYAQVNGNAIQFSWQINTPVAPVGAVSYQWMFTRNNTVTTGALLDVLASPINYLGVWDAHGNAPALAPNIGTVGDTRQITTPSIPTDYRNLGNGVTEFKTGDYVVYNGKSWDIVDKTFADLTTGGNVLALKIDPLRLFNDKYTNAGANTVLSYSFSENDRCTLHYYIDGSADVYINNPCVDLGVLGYDPGSNLVKVEKSATFDEADIAGKNVFIRLYSPKQQDQAASSTQNTTVWFEVGERFSITDGLHDTLSGIITDGDVYYKTRQYSGAIDPNTPYEVLATDFNFSDFYPSEFTSYGRPGTYLDQFEQTERKASIAVSQNFILGSRNNGLTRFYPQDVYGEGDGQTSSSFGAIGVLWQRGDVLLALQEGNIFYIPVNIAWTQLNDQLTGQSISEKLLNNGRYETNGIGNGLAKEAFCFNENDGWMLDPHRGEIFELSVGGVNSINGKMDKYLKRVLQLAYSQGKKIVLFYNRYYKELMVCIETDGGVLILFPFNTTDWNPFEPYTVTPADILLTEDGAHCTVSYDSMTGLGTYTPTTDYVGSDVAIIDVDTPDGQLNKHVCLLWTAGTDAVNPFSFAPRTGQPVSTLILSNTIGVSGNTIPAAISITGDPGFSYSINGGAFTAAPGTVNAGDIVQAQVTSSASNLTDTSCTLIIDGQAATFTVTTQAGAGVNNFTVSAQYGYTFDSVVNNTSTGVPAGLASISVTPGNSLAEAYTAITAGSIDIGISGSPSIPGHIKISLYYLGVLSDDIPAPMPGSYSLNIPAGTDPDAYLIAIDSY